MKHLIEERLKERDELIALNDHLNELHDKFGLTDATRSEIRIKISSRMAQVDISLRDLKASSTKPDSETTPDVKP